MQHWLLTTATFTKQEISKWNTLVNKIRSECRAETGTDPTPKVHMLGHGLEFMSRYHFLGQLAESQLESYHRAFNKQNHQHHHNLDGEYGDCSQTRRIQTKRGNKNSTVIIQQHVG